MRTLPEWIGRTDDEAIPPRVQLRVFQKHDGVCPKCTRKLQPGAWDCDHIVALINGGQHRESNLQPLCVSPCHSQKTRADVAEKSRNYRKRAKHLGIIGPKRKIQSRGFPETKPQRTASRPVERRT